MSHAEYISHSEKHRVFRPDTGRISDLYSEYVKEVHILRSLNFDAVIPVLKSLYSSEKRGKTPRDPVCMLRSVALLTLCRKKSITEWVRKTRSYNGLLSVLCGFPSDSAPGVGTYYDFMRRIIDGPYAPPAGDRVRRSSFITRPHLRSIPDEKEAKKDSADPYNSQSALLAKKLLKEGDENRPEGFLQLLEDMHYYLGTLPSAESGLITDTARLTVTADGSVFPSAACRNGRPTCNCREQGIFSCDHPRLYSSGTAEFCYDHHHDCFTFGDRYYHAVVTQNGHDFPVHAHMPGGNESDYTLSLTSVDRTLKLFREHETEMGIGIFCGDGHHDSYAHYEYFAQKNIMPVIPLREGSKKFLPHLPDNKVPLNEEGTPLCPEGKTMHYLHYNKAKRTHVYNCPVKRQARREGKKLFVFHKDECPRKKDCQPESTIGPYVYIKSETDPRLFPPIPRKSRKFRDVMKLRSGSERVNAVIDSYNIEGAHRCAEYSLIRLYLVYIAVHADIRYRESMKNNTAKTGFFQVQPRDPPAEPRPPPI